MTQVDYYKPLADALSKYLSKSKHLKLIRSAFDYALQKHGDQRRKSGEPYIIHPRDVAITLAEYEVDPNTIVAGLLHDILEDTDTTYEEIKNEFGEEIADIVEGLTKLKQLQYQNSKVLQQAKNHQKMILAMAKDIRVILVKLADRLNNMRTLAFLNDEKQTRISRETLDIFVPIAHRLGMYRLKAELEDLAFKYLYPYDYQEIAKKLREKKGSREADVFRMEESLTNLLKAEGFKFEIKGRIKNIHSVYIKMKNKKIDFDEIHDLLALRIVVETVSDCYRAIGIVHSKFMPVPGRFKDYIAMPKPNMYQSLHTTVVSNGKIYEIQIRTQEMDDIAEKGVAAHWAYKETTGRKSNRKDIETIMSSKLRWYSELIKYTEESDSEEEILDIFTGDILNANVYVFTPKGDIIDLAAGATPLDFAFRIHTKVGEKTVGAIVNDKIRPLDYQLKTGDLVEIKTSKNAVGPNENWLNLAKTSNARSKIKNFLNRQKRDFLVEKGKNDFEKEVKSRHIELSIDDKIVLKNFTSRHIETEEDLYYEIGKGVLSAINVVNVLVGKPEVTEEELLEKYNKLDDQKKKRYVHSDINVIVEGLDKPSIKLANCCKPIYGDKIVGYVSKSYGIMVHRDNCHNLDTYDENRFLDVYWGDDLSKKYLTSLRIYVENRDNILAEIINASTSSKGKIVQVSAQTNDLKQGIITTKIEIGSVSELENLIINMQKVKGVYSIERVGA
ncbi:MAG: bifunctional (p)ppGpp synthetase/guanosine-3',5'-bis(diphosphate) 3'-pyrophosphohydrolase [Candidatus Izemoplasmatales bacterium]